MVSPDVPWSPPPSRCTHAQTQTQTHTHACARARTRTRTRAPTYIDTQSKMKWPVGFILGGIVRLRIVPSPTFNNPIFWHNRRRSIFAFSWCWYTRIYRNFIRRSECYKCIILFITTYNPENDITDVGLICMYVYI